MFVGLATFAVGAIVFLVGTCAIVKYRRVRMADFDRIARMRESTDERRADGAAAKRSDTRMT